MKLIPSSRYWSIHTHSQFSNGDALPTVEQIVSRAAELKYKGIGLTDHGNIAGSVQLYKEAQKRGLRPFPGSEVYFVPSIEQYRRDFNNPNIKASRYHMGVHAFTTQGYQNLVNLSRQTHLNHFHKPHLDLSMLASLKEADLLDGLAITTGCYFGYTIQTLINKGEAEAKQWLATLESFFPGAVYVEQQNHRIEHDEEGEWNDARVAQCLHEIAEDMGLPSVITQDSHYVHDFERPVHETLKQLSSWSDTPDDATFPGDGFHMVDDQWMREHHPEHIFNRGCEGLQDLINRHTLEIPVLDNYTYKVPQVVEDPAAAMMVRCQDALKAKGLWVKDGDDKYFNQLMEEIDVITSTGMAGYIMLVAEVTDYIRSQGWLFHVRGSGAGSLVSWLMGITNVDPIHWDLRFERFLSRDRTKPPDYDIDIQHDKRQELIDWMRTKYVVNSIGTWMRLSMAEEDGDEGSGSIMRKYYQMAGKVGMPTEWSEIPREAKNALYALDKSTAYSGMGKNAAGLVITSTREDFDDVVPIHHSPSNPEGVAQYGKDDIEAMGLVKLDVLGSKTLTVLARCMDSLGVPLDEYLPVERKSPRMSQKHSAVVYREVSKGITDGVFQLEGWSTQKGCKDLKPTVVQDLIAAMALFRPATLDSGATKLYISRKNGKAVAPDRHEIINSVVSSTHGIILYQEQVIDVLRALGMEADPLTEFLKAVKASNKDVGNAQKIIDSHMPWILKRCEEEGFTAEDIHWLDESFEAFGGYSFNRAHSTVYGLTAWRCAYLAHYHPVEFFCALLDVTSESSDAKAKARVIKYGQAAKSRGVRIWGADINASSSGYAIDHEYKAIRKGFTSVHGLGAAAARELAIKRPESGWKSLDQLIEVCDARAVSGAKDYQAITNRRKRYMERRYKIEEKMATNKKLTMAERKFYEGTVEPPEATTDDFNGVIKTLIDTGVLTPLLESTDE